MTIEHENQLIELITKIYNEINLQKFDSEIDRSVALYSLQDFLGSVISSEEGLEF